MAAGTSILLVTHDPNLAASANRCRGGRMVVQLVAIGYVLRFIFSLNNNPAATLLLILIMALVAVREGISASLTNEWRGMQCPIDRCSE
jgi:ABC-type iron transport system FetAB permease component